MTGARARRIAVRVEGVVQGVGFRPFVHRLATELGLAGLVYNDVAGVWLEVEGRRDAVDAFLDRLGAEAPPASAVERVTVHARRPRGDAGFAILPSPPGGEGDVPVSPDLAACAACLAEMRDPGDRRHRYPFVTCTDCGPRFSIIASVPYDRPRTTMAGFTMCPACQAEYDDPGDRRFHAQPNGCPACGPQARLVDASGAEAPGDPVRAAAGLLRDGAIVAIKGLGGYHLACRADAADAVAALRSRKHREHKPFALMVGAAADAAGLVDLCAVGRDLLASPARPIVLAPRADAAAVAPAVAPGMRELGVMLAYTPLHALLFDDLAQLGAAPAALVMTSGNLSDEPIAYRDDDALARLAAVADAFLVHDRPIRTRTDDSVARVVAHPDGPRVMVLRRSRGYVPAALPLPAPAPRPLLAAGAEQKNTFCVVRGARAWMGPHIGDLEHAETHAAYHEGIAHFEGLFAVAPRAVAHDLHPEYLSTKAALERPDVDAHAVQHHHAHLVACLAEHGVDGAAVGAVFDGTGLGPDGTIWGGEILVGDAGGFERVAHLAPVPLPGGARAVREPWRMARAWLDAAIGATGDPPPALAADVTGADWRAVGALAARPGLSTPTTSMGRLFDAAGALCGLCARASYEGQAAVLLEAAAAPGVPDGAYAFAPAEEAGVLDPRPVVAALARDVAAGVDVGVVSARFHEAVAQATAAACVAAAHRHGLDQVVLTGGVFQNRLLLERTAALIDAAGPAVLLPERLPPNDGGIAYGQAVVAVAREGAGA